MNYIGNDYDNYARCKVDYSDESDRYNQFSDGFSIIEPYELEEYLEYIAD